MSAAPATGKTGRRRMSAAARRAEILLGGMRVFAERGYAGASMVEIAGAAGVTAAVVYDHFDSKQALHGALLEEQTDVLMLHVAEAVSRTTETEERMKVGVDAFFEFVDEHPFAWRLIFRDPPADPEIAAVHVRIHKRVTEGIAAFLDISAPGFLRDDASRAETLKMFAELLKMTLNGMANWWYEHLDVPREEVVERVLDFCWRGLGNLEGRLSALSP